MFSFSFDTGAHDDDSSDSEGWEEREASRTHSVKFSEDSGTIDKDTPFVRQNTPHPKELKMKAHKLFAKEKSKVDDGANLDTLSEEVSFHHRANLNCGWWKPVFVYTISVVVETFVGQNGHQFNNHG